MDNRIEPHVSEVDLREVQEQSAPIQESVLLSPDGVKSPSVTIQMCGLSLTKNAVSDSHTSLPLNQITSVSVDLSESGQSMADLLLKAMAFSSFLGMGCLLIFIENFSLKPIGLITGTVAFISAVVLWKSYDIAVKHPEKLEHALRITTGGLNLWSEGRKNKAINELHQLKAEIEERSYS